MNFSILAAWSSNIKMYLLTMNIKYCIEYNFVSLAEHLSKQIVNTIISVVPDTFSDRVIKKEILQVERLKILLFIYLLSEWIRYEI